MDGIATLSSVVPPRSTVSALRKAPDGQDVIVMDAGPLIRQAAQSSRLGHLFAPPGVLCEIRDPLARAQVELHCAKMRTEAPTPEDYRYVKEFAMLTGDGAVLSGVDLDVAALAVKLTRQFMGNDVLNTSLPITKTITNGAKGGLKDLVLDKNILEPSLPSIPAKTETKSDDQEEYDDERDDSETDEDSYYSDCDTDDSDNPWITADNIHLVGQNFEKKIEEREETDVRTHVYCITTDFALQNLLLSMGVKLKTLDGYSIKNVKTWAQKCRSCQHLMMDASKRFCSRCGGYLLRKVALERGDDGEVVVIDNRRAVITKGMNTSLPAPKGGKAGKFKNEVILCEDQLLTSTMRWRQRKAANDRQKLVEDSTDPFAGMGLAIGDKRRTNLGQKWESDFQVAMGRGNPNSKLYHRRNAAKSKRT